MKSLHEALQYAIGIATTLRPREWIKNLLVLAGFLFARQWGDSELLVRVILAVISFCAAASAGYAFNDLRDLAADRAHPVKRHRPLASGDISPRATQVAAIVALCTALGCGFLAGPRLLMIVIAYLALSALYSAWLKHFVIADVFAIAAGFMLRLLAGTFGVGVPPSAWLLLTSLFLTLFLGFAKRRAELIDATDVDDRTRRRRVMADYSASLLDTFLAITAACTILSYGLYSVAPETRTLHSTGHLVYTVPFVAYAVLRYLYLVHMRGQGEEPGKHILADRQVLVSALAWLATTIFLIH